MRRSPDRWRAGSAAAAGAGRGFAPLRWLARLHPLQSWLVVMGVIVGLSMLGLRVLALLVAVAWTGYAVFTWLPAATRRRFRRR